MGCGHTNPTPTITTNMATMAASMKNSSCKPMPVLWNQTPSVTHEQSASDLEYILQCAIISHGLIINAI